VYREGGPQGGGVALAGPRFCRDTGGDVAPFGIQNSDVHQQGTQLEEIQVVANHSGQVLVVHAVTVPVEVGRVLPALSIAD